MNRRLKLILPLTNIAVAIVLLWIGSVKSTGDSASRGYLALLVCNMSNVPANLFRNVVMPPLEHILLSFWPIAKIESCYSFGHGLGICLFLAGVGVTWYMVAVQLQPNGADPSDEVILAHLTGSVIADIVLICAGVFFALVGISEFISLRWYSSAKAFESLLPYAVWSIATIVTYGRDILKCLSRPVIGRTG
jgi:hypothetical protein